MAKIRISAHNTIFPNNSRQTTHCYIHEVESQHLRTRNDEGFMASPILGSVTQSYLHMP